MTGRLQRERGCKTPMMRRLLLGLILLGMSACAPSTAVDDGAPRLVAEVTVDPADSRLPTRALTPTPLPPTQRPENRALADQVTQASNFVLVTPTLPPSKTPTATATFTPSPTDTPTPTPIIPTATVTGTPIVIPTSAIIPLAAPLDPQPDQVCASTWFFLEPRPPSCPRNPPNATQGVYQAFQNGYMIWVGNQDAIYVLYNDAAQPRWEVYRDYFNEGMAEETLSYENAPPNTWQPRRGFGLLWRTDVDVRQRIGWATLQWEMPYSVRVQVGQDGTIFMNTPVNSLVALFPQRVNWQLYRN